MIKFLEMRILRNNYRSSIVLLVAVIALNIFPDMAIGSVVVPKQTKAIKKIYKKHPFKVYYVFGGAKVDQQIVNRLNEEMPLINACAINATVQSVGNTCAPCNEVKLYFDGAAPSKVFSINLAGRPHNCNNVSVFGYSDYATLSDAIEIQIIKNKKLPPNIYIYIPPQNNNEVEEFIKNGWIIEEPENLESFDKKEAKDCADETVYLFKKKPCSDVANFKIAWDWDNSGWQRDSENPNLYHLFPPSFDNDSFFLYFEKVCGTSFILVFYDEYGTEVARFRRDLDAVSNPSQKSNYYEFKLNQNPDVTGYLEYGKIYSVEMVVENSINSENRPFKIQNLEFIFCQKERH